jgi:carbamoyltransferase
MLINTSFNMHEEPIVCSPNDALSAFHRGAADILVMEGYWLEGQAHPDLVL